MLPIHTIIINLIKKNEWCMDKQFKMDGCLDEWIDGYHKCAWVANYLSTRQIW